MKKLGVIILCASILFSNSNPGLAKAAENPVKPVSEEAVKGGEILEDLVKTEKEMEKEEIVPKGIAPEKEEAIENLNLKMGDSSENSKNPDFYAGIYLDEDETVVVNTTAKTKKVLQKLEETSGYDELKVIKVPYSLSDLKKVKKMISDFYTDKFDSSNGKLEQMLESLQTVSVDVVNNCVLVRMKDLNDEKIALFKDRISDSDMIKFENMDKEISAVKTSLSAGQGVFVADNNNSTSGYWYSLGCRAVWIDGVTNDKLGFVTAAHNNSVGQRVYVTNYLTNANCIGYISRRHMEGLLDAAFVEVTNNNYKLTNTIYGLGSALTDSYYYPSLTAGMILQKSGMATGHTMGTITNASCSVYYDGVQFTDFVESTTAAQPGDSGGVAFCYDDSAKVTAVAGITAATNGTYSWFTKYNNIRTHLGLHPY